MKNRARARARARSRFYLQNKGITMANSIGTVAVKGSFICIDISKKREIDKKIQAAISKYNSLAAICKNACTQRDRGTPGFSWEEQSAGAKESRQIVVKFGDDTVAYLKGARKVIRNEYTGLNEIIKKIAQTFNDKESEKQKHDVHKESKEEVSKEVLESHRGLVTQRASEILLDCNAQLSAYQAASMTDKPRAELSLHRAVQDARNACIELRQLFDQLGQEEKTIMQKREIALKFYQNTFEPPSMAVLNE